MNRVSYIGWLAGQAAEGLSYFWPVTLALLALVACALLLDIKRARLKLHARLLCLLLPAMGVLLILPAGSLFERRPSLFYLPYIGFGITALLAIVTAVTVKPGWMTSISSSVCLLWLSFWSWVVSMMSINGDWL